MLRFAMPDPSDRTWCSRNRGDCRCCIAEYTWRTSPPQPFALVLVACCMVELLRKKGIYALFLLILFSSCSPSCRNWLQEDATAAYPCYPMGKLYLPPQSQYCGIELEFVRGSDGLRTYINVFSVPIPEDACNPGKAVLCILVDEEPHPVFVDILEGGQRCLLPPEAASIILTALSQGCSVQLKISRYSETLISDNFIPLYCELMNN